MVKISGCFHYNIMLCYVMKLAGMICKLDRFLENLQIVQCNLQIGQIGRLEGTSALFLYLRRPICRDLCMCACMRVHGCVCTCVCVRVYVYVCMCTCVCTCVRVYDARVIVPCR